jgi:hypothetical protein
MQNGGDSEIQGAANWFLDYLAGGGYDEAAVVHFNSSATLVQQMTSNFAALRTAVGATPATGGARMYDGVYAGLQELLQRDSGRSYRTVLLISNGNDDGSTHSLLDVVTFARKHELHIHVFGVGQNIRSDSLQWLAANTGGSYSGHPQTAQFLATYRQMELPWHFSNQECIIVYKAKCMDGSVRNLDVSLVHFCGGSDTRTRQYTAPRDTSVFMPVNLSLGRPAPVRDGRELRVPLQLFDDLRGQVLQPANFEVQYDPQCVIFTGIKASIGGVWDGMPIAVEAGAGRLVFRSTEARSASISALPSTLAELTFRTADLSGRDTICCDLALERWTFEAGCLRPVLKGGRICIIPRQPDVVSDITVPPQLRWDAARHDYVPNPFTVSTTLLNVGDREASTARLRLELPDSTLLPVSPKSAFQNASPPDVVPSGISQASWELLARPRLAGDSLLVCIVASFDNHDSIRSCIKIWIPGVATTEAEHLPVAAAFPLDVFPDPAKDYITVVMNGTDRTDGKRVTISIIDAAGRVVATDCEVDARYSTSISISLKEQPSGLYFVTGTSGRATVVRKFVKVE